VQKINDVIIPIGKLRCGLMVSSAAVETASKPIKAKNTTGSGKFSFDVYVSSGGFKTTLKAKIKGSSVECDSITITAVSLNVPFESTIVNGNSQEIKFTTNPVNVGTITRELTSSLLNVGVLSSDGKTFISKGDPGVFNGIQNRLKNVSNINGKIFVAIGSQTLTWDNFNIAITVTNAPPTFVERNVPDDVVFNSPTFETTNGFVIYKDIDDKVEHYSINKANTKNDGADDSAVIDVVEGEKIDIEESKRKFKLTFKTVEGIKVFRKIMEFQFTLVLEVGFGIEGNTTFRFEVPLSELSRFTKSAIIVAIENSSTLSLLLPDDLKDKIGGAATTALGVTSRDVVNFTPVCSYSSGGNKIVIDGGNQGLPFKATKVNEEKIKISVGGNWVKTF
jgi:hypothetical protein